MNENNAHLMQHLVTNNPPPLATPILPEVERSHRSHRSGDGESQSRHTLVGHKIANTSHQAYDLGKKEALFCRNPSHLAELMKVKQNNASHLITIHQKDVENLKDYIKRFNQAILEVEDTSDKVVVMAMIKGLRPKPLFDSLFRNISETQSALQSKADKYIAAKELAEDKRRRQGREDYKRKELDSREPDYQDEPRYSWRSNTKEFIKWPKKIKTNHQRRNKNKYYEFHIDQTMGTTPRTASS
ncbi:hypothetical protein Acr_00g0028480 [Actinidia rufa]|uniref:Uncharacterized protein n=1 Tax=Actinidia rufa TaxID=165716 RepID=A0A7J0DET8_9ERIC|nr:hypothetical protein Acr_00g0028480 [Actinidia rufa]